MGQRSRESLTKRSVHPPRDHSHEKGTIFSETKTGKLFKNTSAKQRTDRLLTFMTCSSTYTAHRSIGFCYADVCSTHVRRRNPYLANTFIHDHSCQVLSPAARTEEVAAWHAIHVLIAQIKRSVCQLKGMCLYRINQKPLSSVGCEGEYFAKKKF